MAIILFRWSRVDPPWSVFIVAQPDREGGDGAVFCPKVNISLEFFQVVLTNKGGIVSHG